MPFAASDGGRIAMNPKTDFADQIYTGDCLKILRKLPKSSVHLAITSPPYNLGVGYDGYDDRRSYQSYLKWMRMVGREVRRVLVKGGRFALNVAPTGIRPFLLLHHDLVQCMLEEGFETRTEILWYKQTMRRRTAWGSWKSPGNPHIIPSWEYIYVFNRKRGEWDLPGKKSNCDITADEFKKFSDGFWEITPETRKRQPFLKSRQKGLHPASFPEPLIYRIVKYYSFKGNVVLDPFGGSGTVAVVARKTGRKFIHIDTSQDYNEIAAFRINGIPSPEDVLFPEET